MYPALLDCRLDCLSLPDYPRRRSLVALCLQQLAETVGMQDAGRAQGPPPPPPGLLETSQHNRNLEKAL